MPQSLPRKLRYVFTVQVVLTTLAMLVAFSVIGSLVKESMTSDRLREEAATWWDARAADPDAPLPRTSAVSGYFVPAGGDDAGVPAEMRGREPGIHLLPNDERHRKIWVERREAGTLYLIAAFWLVERVVFWTGLASMAMAFSALVLVTWLSYRSSKRLVRPVNWLAQEVARWDPRQPDLDAIGPERIPDGAGSEVRQLGGALRDLADRTRAYVRREREFTRDASHELRTPLTVIRMATDLMRGDPDTPSRMQRPLERVRQAGQDMEAVIDAFLILARDDDVAPQREDFDVAEVVHEAADKGRDIIGQRPVALDVVVNATPVLHASRSAFSVLLDNLVSNACVFTEQGQVEIRIEADRVVVSDTGIGMAPDILQRAYDPFFRADQFQAAGKGMGLSIVRRIGERFGWPVTLESAQGEGTVATIGLGRVEQHAVATAA